MRGDRESLSLLGFTQHNTTQNRTLSHALCTGRTFESSSIYVSRPDFLFDAPFHVSKNTFYHTVDHGYAFHESVVEQCGSFPRRASRGNTNTRFPHTQVLPSVCEYLNFSHVRCSIEGGLIPAKDKAVHHELCLPNFLGQTGTRIVQHNLGRVVRTCKGPRIFLDERRGEISQAKTSAVRVPRQSCSRRTRP